MSSSAEITSTVALFQHLQRNAVDNIWCGKLMEAGAKLGYAQGTTSRAVSYLCDVGSLEYLERGNFGAPSMVKVLEPPPRETFSRIDAWTAEANEKLLRLWKQGLSATEIGKILGVTKNSVIGRKRRLGGDSRPSPIKGDNAARSYPKQRKTNVVAKAPPKPIAAKKDVPRAGALMRGSGKASVSVIARPMIVEFRVPTAPTQTKFLADAGVDCGPSLHPCQWPVRDGSVTTPWVFCGIERAVWPYCAAHMKRAYGKQSEAA